MEIDIYYKAPKQLFNCCGFLSKDTGELVELTHSAKIIFMYMMDRTSFFVENQRSEHYETQATIAEACGMEYKAAARALNSFVDHKAIKANKIRNLKVSQHYQWYYKQVDASISLVKKVGNDFICMDTGQILVKKNVEVKDKKGNISNLDKFFVDSGYETVDTVQTQEDIPPSWCTEPVDVYNDNIYIDFIGNN